MTFDQIIKSIEKNIYNANLKDEFIYVFKISNEEEERAYNLGLFFDKQRKENFQIIIDLKIELEYLTDYYDNKDLKDLFLLKSTKIVSTRLSPWSYPLLVFGLVVIILGILRQYNGLYRVTVGTKHLPVYHTGLLYVIFGLAIFWVAIAPIIKRKKYNIFYKKYDVNSNV